MKQGLVQQEMYRKQENSHIGWPDHTGGNQNFDYMGAERIYLNNKTLSLFMAV